MGDFPQVQTEEKRRFEFHKKHHVGAMSGVVLGRRITLQVTRSEATIITLCACFWFF